MANIILNLARGAAEHLWQTVIIGPIDFNSTKLTGVETGTADTDGVNKGQMDTALALKANKSEKVVVPIRIIGTTAETGVLAQNDFGLGMSPVAGSITKVTLVSHEATATVDVDVLAGATFAALASLVGAGTKPGISAAQESVKSSFTNWTGVAVTAGGVIQVKATTASPTAVKTLMAFVEITRT
jgi:hypothetical protein